MLRIAVVTLFPAMLKAVTDYGVTGRAVKNGLVEIITFNPRDYCNDTHRTVDDRPYGGGPGMVMMFEPLRDAIQTARKEIKQASVIYLTPQGKRLNQDKMIEFSQSKGLIMVAGRYEGIDERLVSTVIDEEWSIGDYVLTGGELPAMVMIDAMSRNIPGVLGHEESAKEDSFFNGLLDCPHYTRPEDIDGMKVPEVLLSGNHAQIQRWRIKVALGRTWHRRPDLLEEMQLDKEQKLLLEEYIEEYNRELPQED